MIEWIDVALFIWNIIDAIGLFCIRALLILTAIVVFIWSLIG